MGEFGSLPNFGYVGHMPAETLLQMLPFTPQYKEAQFARQLNEQKLKQLEREIEFRRNAGPAELALLQAQTAAQGAATEASRASAANVRANTPTGVDRWLNRGKTAADIAGSVAGAKESKQRGDYYNTLGLGQKQAGLQELLQSLPMFDEVEENVEVPGWFGSKMTKQKRQVPGAARTTVLQKLAEMAGVPQLQQPQTAPAASRGQPGMADALSAAQKQAMPPATTKQAPPREGFGRTVTDVFGGNPLRGAGRAVGQVVPMLQPGIEAALQQMGMVVPNVAPQQAVQPTAIPNTLSQQELQTLLQYIRGQ